MPRIKASSIEELRHRVNIVDVVEPYVALKRSGSSYKGLSPFNPEKTPSFHVHPDKGFFYCFSSKNGGDMFRFVILMEQLEFPEAVEFIANRMNIPLEYEEDGSPPEARSLRKELFEIHEIATDYFHQAFLAETESGKYIRHYWLNERGFSQELAQTFQIGFAPLDDTRLLERLRKKHYSSEALVRSGLFYGGEHSSNLRLRFNARLMIPIRDIQGRVIAFTARQTKMTPQTHEVEKSKYINSPETPIFIKKQMLFNLDRARTAAKDTGRFLLVEGQLDALRCFEQGIGHAVAPQGSAVSEEQILYLKRYANGLDCLLDADKAGRDAAMRVLPIALRCGIDVRFLPLPQGQDPDDLLRAGGEAAFTELEKHAENAMTFAVKTLLPNPITASSIEKQTALKKLYEIIRLCPSSVMQDDFIKEISRLTYIERGSLERDLRQFGGQRPQPTTGINSKKHSEWLTTAEDELLLLAINHPEVCHGVAHIIDHKWINTENPKGRLLARILVEYREDLWSGTETIDSLIENEEEQSIAYFLLNVKHHYEEPTEVANKAIKALHKRYIDTAIKQQLLALANSAPEQQILIMETVQKMRSELSETPQLPIS